MAGSLKVCKFLLLCVFIKYTSGSFCGEAAVPFSFEALPNGQPVLGCARPTCFGWTLDGHPAGSQATFYRMNRRADGYFRKATDTPRAIAASDAHGFKPQLAHCAATFDAEQCPSDSQWIGGFGPLVNASGLPLAVQCCEYKPLKLSEDRGVAVVNAGQIVIGGEVLNGERQYAFDYISDVVKHTSPEGKITYDVSIRRLPCLPYPPEFSVSVDASVKDEVLKRFSKAVRVQSNTKAAKAHQASLLNVADNEIVNAGAQLAANALQTNANVPPTADIAVGAQGGQVIEGPFIAENEAIVETANAVPPGQQAIQGLQLPDGQVPQNVVNSPSSSSYYPVCPPEEGGFFCFSADTLVNLSSGKVKRMDELTTNDWILSANKEKLVYSKVESWIHRMPEVNAEFIKFTLEDGKVLKITNKHFIYRGDCSNVGNYTDFVSASSDMVYAQEVQESDCLFVHQNSKLIERRITQIDYVREKGIYAPMTSNTNIIVNDIHASCFNIIKNKEVQNSLALHLKWWASSLIGEFFGGKSEEANEIELVPGMQTLVQILTHIVPAKF